MKYLLIGVGHLVILTLFCSSFWFNIGSKETGYQTYDHIPDVSDSDVQATTILIEDILNDQVDTPDLTAYFALYWKIREVKYGCDKRLATPNFTSDKTVGLHLDPTCQAFVNRFAMSNSLVHRRIQSTIETKTDHHTYLDISQRYVEDHPDRTHLGTVEGREEQEWLNFYSQVIILAFLWFQLQNIWRGNTFWIGTFDVKQWLAAVAWPIGIIYFTVDSKVVRLARVLRFFISLVGCFFLWSSGALAQTKPKTPKREQSISQQYRFWITGDWNTINGARLGNTRLQATYTLSDWKIFTDLNLGSLQDKPNNWLNQANIGHTYGKTTFKIGRFATAANFTPPPFQLKTARYARSPFSLMATGIQLSDHSIHGWNLKGDLTFTSDTLFASTTQFDHLESSARITRMLTETSTVSVLTKLNHSSVAFGFTGAYANEWVEWQNIVYAKHKKNTTLYGGYTFLSFTPKPWMEVHTQVDYQNQNGSGDTIFTTGIRLLAHICKTCVTSFTVDAVTNHRTSDTNIEPVVKAQFTFAF